MTTFDQIKKDIIIQLSNVQYQGDIGDIGNEIGVAIAKYTMDKDAYENNMDKQAFIHGLNHGISLIDGTHG